MKSIILFLFLFIANILPQSQLLLMVDGGGASVDTTGNYLTSIYITRVKGDGGIVIDSAFANQCINDMVTNNYNGGYCFYDASLGIKKDANNKVTKIYDLFGTNDATQADTSLSPTWYADSLSGLPTLKFDGVDDFVTMADNWNGESGTTWAFVTSFDKQVVPGGDSQSLIGQGGGLWSQDYKLIDYQGYYMTIAFGGWTDQVDYIQNLTTVSAWSPKIYELTIDVVDTTCVFYINSTTDRTLQLSGADFTWGRMVIGQTYGATLNPFRGRVSSVIILNKVYDLRTFLNNKYTIY